MNYNLNFTVNITSAIDANLRYTLGVSSGSTRIEAISNMLSASTRVKNVIVKNGDAISVSTTTPLTETYFSARLFSQNNEAVLLFSGILGSSVASAYSASFSEDINREMTVSKVENTISNITSMIPLHPLSSEKIITKENIESYFSKYYNISSSIDSKKCLKYSSLIMKCDANCLLDGSCTSDLCPSDTCLDTIPCLRDICLGDTGGFRQVYNIELTVTSRGTYDCNFMFFDSNLGMYTHDYSINHTKFGSDTYEDAGSFTIPSSMVGTTGTFDCRILRNGVDITSRATISRTSFTFSRISISIHIDTNY